MKRNRYQSLLNYLRGASPRSALFRVSLLGCCILSGCFSRVEEEERIRPAPGYMLKPNNEPLLADLEYDLAKRVKLALSLSGMSAIGELKGSGRWIDSDQSKRRFVVFSGEFDLQFSPRSETGDLVLFVQDRNNRPPSESRLSPPQRVGLYLEREYQNLQYERELRRENWTTSRTLQIRYALEIYDSADILPTLRLTIRGLGYRGDGDIMKRFCRIVVDTLKKE